MLLHFVFETPRTRERVKMLAFLWRDGGRGRTSVKAIRISGTHALAVFLFAETQKHHSSNKDNRLPLKSSPEYTFEAVGTILAYSPSTLVICGHSAKFLAITALSRLTYRRLAVRSCSVNKFIINSLHIQAWPLPGFCCFQRVIGN